VQKNQAFMKLWKSLFKAKPKRGGQATNVYLDFITGCKEVPVPNRNLQPATCNLQQATSNY
jgi:hypothetical protein